MTFFRKRGWVLFVTAVVAAGSAYLVASRTPASYTAEAVAFVAADTKVLTPDQAKSLAVTDAELIPNDSAVARSVARRLHITTEEVRRRLTAFNDPQTALLRIDYRGTSPENALLGVRAVVEAVAGKRPVSPTFARGSIQVARLPSTATTTRSAKTIVVLAGLLGLALGGLLSVAWNRFDPRIDDVDGLAEEVSCPVSVFETMSPAAATAMLERWRELSGSQECTVALVPPESELEYELRIVASRLAGLDETHRTKVGAASPRSDRPSRPGRSVVTAIVVGGAVGAEAAGEGLALGSDLTVLAVRTGERRGAVRAAQDVLREFGVQPAWALLVGPPGEVTEVRQIGSGAADSRPGLDDRREAGDVV